MSEFALNNNHSLTNYGIVKTTLDESLYEKFEDTKGAIRICISNKNRQHNGQKKKYKQRSAKLKIE